MSLARHQLLSAEAKSRLSATGASAQSRLPDVFPPPDPATRIGVARAALTGFSSKIHIIYVINLIGRHGGELSRKSLKSVDRTGNGAA